MKTNEINFKTIKYIELKKLKNVIVKEKPY